MLSPHAAWFDTVNQSHGAEATGRPSISLRVDGISSDALRRHIPFPRHKAAAPAHFSRLLERDA